MASTFPRGNAQEGDIVWYRPPADQEWQKDWKVTEVGLDNEHGYPLNVRIARGPESHVVSPFPPSSDLQAG